MTTRRQNPPHRFTSRRPKTVSPVSAGVVNMKTCCKLPAFLALFCLVMSASAQRPGVNYDESKVPAYTLPDALTCADGTRVTSAEIWKDKRRPELLELFEEQVYGRAP